MDLNNWKANAIMPKLGKVVSTLGMGDSGVPFNERTAELV